MQKTGIDLTDYVHLEALGFTPNEDVSQLVRCCDGYLTKPGGSTAAESLNVPGLCQRMIIHCAKDHPNEFENASLLWRNGATILDDKTAIYAAVMKSNFEPILRPAVSDNTVSQYLALSLGTSSLENELGESKQEHVGHKAV